MVTCAKCKIKFDDDEGIFVNIRGTKEFFLCYKDFQEFNSFQDTPSSRPEGDK